MRPCLSCKKPGNYPRHGRCQACYFPRQDSPQRRAYKAQRYNKEYRSIRKRWVDVVATGQIKCPRCNEPIIGPWDLDHYKDQLLPAHPACNRGKRND